MKIYKDPIFGFYEFFNEKNGILVRTDILTNDTRISPFKRSYPELIDIGIMGKCDNQRTCKENGIYCYQNYESDYNMSFEDYCMIIDQSKNKTFQVALGGRGDPNKHEKFIEILKYTVDNGIIPNLTTSGLNITKIEIEAIKKYCGAVAVSCYSKIVNDVESNQSFIEITENFSKDIITNVHYVISKDTIDDAIYRLQNDLFPKRINSVIFLLFKPVGTAINHIDKCVIPNDKLIKFFSIIFDTNHRYKIGFDSCFTHILFLFNFINESNYKWIQNCESGRFSCYINYDLKMYPCSFAKLKEYECDLHNMSIEEAWFSDNIKKFVALNKGNPSLCPLKLNSFVKNKNN